MWFGKDKGKNTHYVDIIFADEGEQHKEFTNVEEMNKYIDKLKIQINQRKLIQDKGVITNLGMVITIYYGEI